MVGAIHDVVVIGAGFAGLVAADSLARAGARVIVLEARDRVGGRVYGIDVGGVTIEIGGRWTGPGQSAVKALAAELGVPTFAPSAVGATVTVQSGRRSVSDPAGGRLATGTVPLDQTIAAVHALDHLSLKVNLEAPWESVDARTLDAMTLAAWLETNCPPDVAAYLGAVMEGFLPEPHECSLLHALFYMRSNHGLAGILGMDGPAHDSELFVGGAHQISDRLAARLGESIRLRSPVDAITVTSHGVEVVTAGAPVRSRFAIVALPPTLAGRIRYDPPMPPLRDYLVQRTPIRGKFSVGLTYPRAFWREAGLSGMMRHDILFGWDPGGDGGGCLGLLIGNRESRRLATLPQPDRRRVVLAAVAECLGSEAAAPSAYAEIYWAGEAFSRGCNSYLPPGAWTGYGSAWHSPVGPIHWAAAELSPDFVGQMDGAVRSGQRAAAAILARLAR